MQSKILLTGLAFLFVSVVRADDWPQFRGPARTGVSKEKGLLQEWPEKGPKLLWTYRDAGLGFSGPSIVGDRLYTLGGWDDGEYALGIDLKTQKEVWKVKLGKLFGHGNWGDGPRSNPTVDGDLVFALGGYGDLVCLKVADGKEVWRKNLETDFGGVMMSDAGNHWGYSESPLVDGDVLIVTPGGSKGTLAALDKKTGKLIWQSEGLKHAAPYSSAMISNAAGVKQYIQASYIDEHEGGFLSGFDAKTGKPLWTKNLFKKHSYAVAPTPIVVDDLVYMTSGYGGGVHLFQISKAGAGLEAKELYSPEIQKTMKNTHGGVVLLDGKIYGHSEVLNWTCQDFKTGKILWNDREQILETRQSGATTAADNRLYFLSDTGECALVVPNPKEMEEAGRFTLPEKSKLRITRPTLRAAAVWTHPVIANGKLYLRDQELIFCFDVKK